MNLDILITILTVCVSIVAFGSLGLFLIVHKIDKIYDELEQLTHLDDEDEGE